MSVFISHSSEDEECARKIANRLENQDITVWYDEWSLRPGDSIVSKIEAGIEDADVLLVLLSEASLESSWVQAEINASFNKMVSDENIRLIPVLIEDVEVPLLLRDRQYVDLREDFESGIEPLIKSLSPGANPCLALKDEVIIDDFDSGNLRPNMLGGSALVYHENGDPLSLRPLFLNRKKGRSLGLEFDFEQHSNHPTPPQFVGYATRLQYANWSQYVECGYNICFSVLSDGNAPFIDLEIKRLALPPREDTREEIATCRVDLPLEWETKCLRLSDIAHPHAAWNNLWEICFVLYRDDVAGVSGRVQIDDLRLSRQGDN